MQKKRCIARSLALAGTLTGVSAPSAGVLDLEAIFGTTSSIWGNRSPADIQGSVNLGGFNYYHPDFQLGVSDWESTRLLSWDPNTEFGFQFDATFDLNHRFGVGARMNGGTVTTDLPYDVQLQLPDMSTVRGGDTIRIGSTATLRGNAGFRTLLDPININLNHEYYHAVYDTDFDICVGLPVFGGSDPDCRDWDPPGGVWSNTGYPTSLVTFDGSSANTGSINGAYDSLMVGIPSLETTGSLAGDRLTSSGTNDFFDLDGLDPLKVIPGSPTRYLSYELSTDAAGIRYDIIDLAMDLALGLSQDFTLTPGDLIVILDFGGGHTVEFSAGSTVDVTLPDGWVPEDGFSVSYRLPTQFSNDTGLAIDFYALMRALSFETFGDEILGISLDFLDSSYGPLWQQGIPLDYRQGFFQSTFDLDHTASSGLVTFAGLDVDTQRQVLPLPPPLALAGLPMLWVLWRHSRRLSPT